MVLRGISKSLKFEILDTTELVKEVLDIISKLKKQKITMLIVSHEMNFVKEISDKIIVLEKGEILEIGNSETIFNNPKTERVRQFLNNEY